MDYADLTAVKIVTQSTVSEPVFGESDFYVRSQPCTIFARWVERTGVLWIEHIIVDGVECNVRLLSTDSRNNLEDAVVLEIGRNHF